MVRSVLAVFVPTFFRVKKLVDVTPAPSMWAGVPPPTQSLRSIVFQPYILCIGLFGILFLGGAFWTYQCRREIRVLQPQALAQDNDELEDLSKKKRSTSQGKESGSKASGSKAKGKGSKSKGKGRGQSGGKRKSERKA
jgi:hypothetical protein